MLFSNEAVAELMKSFECAWEEVRPVPIVNIDFGNGHNLKRTLNGNIVTFLCTADGRAFDILPGLYDADTFAARLREGLALFEGAKATGTFDEAVKAYHKSRLEGVRTLEEERMMADVRKMVVENPIKEALGLRMEKAKLADSKKRRVEQPIKDAMRPDVGKGMVEQPIKEAFADIPKSAVELPIKEKLSPSESMWGLKKKETPAPAKDDAEFNERERMPAIHAMLASGLPKVGDAYKGIYKDLLHVDLDDPYLGLAPAVLGGDLGRDVK